MLITPTAQRVRSALNTPSPPRKQSKTTSTKNKKKSNPNARTGGLIGRFQPHQGAELKFFDTVWNFVPGTTSAVSASTLTQVPRGTAADERIGSKIEIKSISLHGRVSYNPGGTTGFAASTTYLFLILDTECNGAFPSVADIFSNAADIGVYHRDMSNSKRFSILKKFVFNFSPNAGVSGAWAADIQDIEYYTQCNIPIAWETINTDGTIGNQTQNNIFFVTQTTAGPWVTMTFNTRIRYSDTS